MAHRIEIALTVTVGVSRESGKFASLDEIREALVEKAQEALETLEGDQLDGLGADGISVYDIDTIESWEA